MGACPNCGAENPEGAERCGKCGTELKAQAVQQDVQTQSPAPQPAPETKPFERQMENLGQKLAATGQKVGKEAGKMGPELEQMWYGTLGILAPIIGGLIATVVFLIFVLVVGAVAEGSEHRAFWEELRNFLEDNFLLFVGLFFLSSFRNYLHKVHKHPFRWVTPIMTALGFLGWFWILAQVLFIGADTLTRPGLRDLGDLVTLLLPVIFVFVLLIGYVVVVFQAAAERTLRRKTEST